MIQITILGALLGDISSILKTIQANFNIGKVFETAVRWLQSNMSWFFDSIRTVLGGMVFGVNWVLQVIPAFILIALFTALAFWLVDKLIGFFTLIGFTTIWFMGLWTETMSTLSLVSTSVLIALLIGIPIGILCSKNDKLWSLTRPVLDFMQTLPAFVYLIPAVLFFRLGVVPGVVSTLIFSLPPAVRMTNLGIRQVPKEIKEAAASYGSTGFQMLFKAELPVALPSLMAGINQTIMLSLSMVVIAGLIGAGGLGNEVARGVTQFNLSVGFQGGLAIVILAIFLDRVTQSFSKKR